MPDKNFPRIKKHAKQEFQSKCMKTISTWKWHPICFSTSPCRPLRQTSVMLRATTWAQQDLRFRCVKEHLFLNILDYELNNNEIYLTMASGFVTA